MFGEALGQLFLNLDKTAESERSPYDKKLHQELLALADGFQLMRSAERFRPRTIWHTFGNAATRGIGKVAGFSVVAMRDSIDLRTYIDYGSDPDPTEKWDGCPKKDCPNKRRT